ncbi:unnamed protein product, partial [Iphiclides podalirius]
MQDVRWGGDIALTGPYVQGGQLAAAGGPVGTYIAHTLCLYPSLSCRMRARGTPLTARVQDSSRPLGWAARARLARDVAAGLGYLHRMNVIHRDLNSHNCLVREDQTVIVADFGLARIVQRTASSSLPRAPPSAPAPPPAKGQLPPARSPHSHTTPRRKRYTVVGNPYWMAPEMMNGNVYDEKVDVFSFGIVLCEIIGRVSADPDYLPRRGDFGLNEALFLEKFCTPAACPEPFYRVAFLACNLDPDARPPFEVMEIWLESLVMHLSSAGPPPATLLADIGQYARAAPPRQGHVTPECCPQPDAGIFCAARRCHARRCHACHACHGCSGCHAAGGAGAPCQRPPSGAPSLELVGELAKCVQPSAGESEACGGGRALGKCVSASHLAPRAVSLARRAARSRSHNALALAPGYILRDDGCGINITKVDDINEWLEPAQPLKRASPDCQLNNILAERPKTRRVEDGDETDGDLPPFLRNQSVEGLESKSKREVDAPFPFCRHHSIPDRCENDPTIDSDSSDDDLTDISDWYRSLSCFKKIDIEADQPKNILAGIVKRGEGLLAKKSSYDVTDATASETPKIPDVVRHSKDPNRPSEAEPAKLKTADAQKPAERPSFFAKKLLSPKLSRLFKHGAEPVRSRQESPDAKAEKSRSNFFVQRPSSPGLVRSAHRVRPSVDDVLKSDIKLAGMGKPMTPIFRRHLAGERTEFTDRYSCRERKPKAPKSEEFVEVGRNRIKAPAATADCLVLSSGHTDDGLPEKKVEASKRRELAISRSNYVSLANLKINGKQDLGRVKEKCPLNSTPPVERVI